MGSTLIELLVVLAILGVIAGITGLAFRGQPDARRVGNLESRVTEARRQAIRTARPVTVTVVTNGRTAAATAYPDGSVVADTAFAIDRFSGKIAP